MALHLGQYSFRRYVKDAYRLEIIRAMHLLAGYCQGNLSSNPGHFGPRPMLKEYLNKIPILAAKGYPGKVVSEHRIRDLENPQTKKYCTLSNDVTGIIDSQQGMELLNIFLREAHNIAIIWLTCSAHCKNM
jgi:hypothetical protein